MTCETMIVRGERPADAPAIDQLHDEAFGPGRFVKTAYRIREGAPAVAPLSFVATDSGRLVGSIRFTALSIGGVEGALLLGPLAVLRDYTGQRCGLRLMQYGLRQAKRLGYRLVILVGDLPYYRKAEFARAPAGRIALPGPVDPQRLLVRELHAGALEAYSGMVGLPATPEARASLH